MKPIYVARLSEADRSELSNLYRRTKDPRLRTRTQMVLLSAEQGLTAPKIAEIVRENEGTVRTWLKRYGSEGIEGLSDAPRPGIQPKVTPEWRARLVALVRRRPRSLDLPYSLWTCQRLAEVLAEDTGIRVSSETVRRYLKREGIVISRPQHKISSPDPEYEVKKDDRRHARRTEGG